MVVMIDGNMVWQVNGAAPSCGVLGYVQHTIDVSAYADGGDHLVTFYSEVFGTNGGNTNFFVDDVVLDVVSNPNPSSVTITFDVTVTQHTPGIIHNDADVFYNGAFTNAWADTEIIVTDFWVYLPFIPKSNMP
jgi:hypothetical protein